jgi:hypothetical protein
MMKKNKIQEALIVSALLIIGGILIFINAERNIEKVSLTREASRYANFLVKTQQMALWGFKLHGQVPPAYGVKNDFAAGQAILYFDWNNDFRYNEGEEYEFFNLDSNYLYKLSNQDISDVLFLPFEKINGVCLAENCSADTTSEIATISQNFFIKRILINQKNGEIIVENSH